MRSVPRAVFLVLAASAALLPWGGASPALAAGDAATTVLVLDVSGSMDDPARIPPDFPKAAQLKERQDAVGRLVEQAHPGNKVPLSVIAGGLMGLPDLLSLRSDLDDYLKKHNVDPASISKLAALKAAAGAMLAAVQFERDHAGADDRVGVVTFSSDSTVLAQPTAQVAGLIPGVQALTTSGSTNMGAGLQSALDLLRNQPNPSIILLTDGWNNDGMTNDEVLRGPVATAASGKVPVCTVGLGQAPADVDQRLLLDIAGRTGGGYHFVDSDSSLGGDLLACHQSLAGETLSEQRGTVRQGQTVQGQAFAVPAGHHRLSVTLSWPGSQLDLRVTDPSGKAVGTGYPGASVTRGAGVAVLTVANPTAGRWGLSVAGVQTAAGGEPFVATAATEGATGGPHRDAVLGAALAPLDATQQQLLLTRNVTAVIAGVLVVLWLLGLVTRPFRRRNRNRPAPPVAAVVAGPYGGPPVPGQPAYPPQPPYPPAAPQGSYPVPAWTPPPPSPGSVPQAGAAPAPPPPGVYTPGYAPPPVPAGYPVQPAYAAPGGPVAMPPQARPRSGGCLGCLGRLVFVTDVIVLGASAAALYLWTTPLLTFPG
ncbi:MAG TPA: VWA domain-containing protein [Candidatus Dormibacteraeota bacterium]|nr:VWA domain-containing protein [Candidatus Dormibacteraeota bacterium]